MGRPNVVLLEADQQKATSLPLYGNGDVRAPHLQALAARGVVAEQCRAQSSFCAPSRASLLTGRYPTGTRCHQNGQPPPADEVLLQEVLRAAGYRTAGIGHLHGPAYFGRGWDVYSDFSRGTQRERWALRRELVDRAPRATQHMVATLPLPPDEDVDGIMTTEALAFLESAARTPDRPFFLHVAYISPHPPYFVSPPYDALYDPDALALPPPEPAGGAKPPQYRRAALEMGTLEAPEDERRRALATYYGMNSYLDDQVGRLLAGLARLGLAERTIVVYTSDHGDFAGEHDLFGKTATLYDCLLRVPLVVAGPPDLVPQGMRLDGLVEHIDVFPTLLELLGLRAPPRVAVHGDSLRRLWEAPGAGEGRGAEYEVEGFGVSYADVGLFGLDTLGVTNVPFGPSPAGRQRELSVSLRTREWKYVHTPGRPIRELYHVPSDPGELRNLYGEPAHEPVVRALQNRLLDWPLTYV